jgi:hypothetical protein
MSGLNIKVGEKVVHLSEDSALQLIARLKAQGTPQHLDIAAKFEERLVKAEDA